MMRRQLTAWVGAAAMAAVAAGTFVHAQTQDAPATPPAAHGRRGPGGPGQFGGPFGPGGFGRGGFGGPMAMLRQLDLTDEQRTQVQQVMQGHRDELRALEERLRAAHKAEEDAVTAATFDEQAVRTKSADLAAVMADAAVLHAKLHSEVFAVLTPEQQAKAAELKAEREARMEQFRERVRTRVQERQQQRTQPGAAK